MTGAVKPTHPSHGDTRCKQSHTNVYMDFNKKAFAIYLWGFVDTAPRCQVPQLDLGKSALRVQRFGKWFLATSAYDLIQTVSLVNCDMFTYFIGLMWLDWMKLDSP